MGKLGLTQVVPGHTAGAGAGTGLNVDYEDEGQNRFCLMSEPCLAFNPRVTSSGLVGRVLRRQGDDCSYFSEHFPCLKLCSADSQWLDVTSG